MEIDEKDIKKKMKSLEDEYNELQNQYNELQNKKINIESEMNKINNQLLFLRGSYQAYMEVIDDKDINSFNKNINVIQNQ